MEHTPITDQQIADLRGQYPNTSLHQLEMPDGRQFVVRGSSFDEFNRLVKSAAGRESRLPLDIVRTFVVHPVIDPADLEYNKSLEWGPGLVMALSEKIQELLGYSKEISVKKL